MNAYQSISAHTEEVSVIAEEQASMVAETTRSIQNLARLAEELKKNQLNISRSKQVLKYKGSGSSSGSSGKYKSAHLLLLKVNNL